MTEQSNADVVKAYFWGSKKSFRAIASELVDDPEVVLEEAADLFDQMIPELAYLDRPDAPMASSLFWCSASLALYLALQRRGVDVHDFGRTMLDELARSPGPDPDASGDLNEWIGPFKAAAEASMSDARPGEFVFEVIDGQRDLDWGMNIKSCAICHQYAKHDAMELVPYMCATDDLMSDRAGQGLRRTGTIGLGAHECDFRYTHGGEPLALADSYPQRIRLGTSGPAQRHTEST